MHLIKFGQQVMNWTHEIHSPRSGPLIVSEDAGVSPGASCGAPAYVRGLPGAAHFCLGNPKPAFVYQTAQGYHQRYRKERPSGNWLGGRVSARYYEPM